MMKSKLFLASLVTLVSFARADVPIPGDPVGDKFVEISSDPNIEPGRDTATGVHQLYALASVPAQVVFHPKVLSRLGTLQQMGDKAITEAKTAEPDLIYSGAVITAHTWARKLGASEQKFWVFQVTYRKADKGKPLDTPKVVGHFVAGAYTFHDGKKTFKVEPTPSDHFPFLGTFEPKAGEFVVPAAPAPAPAP
jgi:hypothetical protein